MPMVKKKSNAVIVHGDNINLIDIEQKIQRLLRAGHKIVEFHISGAFFGGPKVSFKEIIEPLLRFRFQLLDKAVVRFKNLPPCLLKSVERMFYFGKNKNDFVKPLQCKKCRYGFRCAGILKNYASAAVLRDIKPVPDLPREVMIEIEPKCNLDCDFCFNKNSFAKEGRNIENKLSAPLIKKIIDNAAKVGVPTVRFTGGEPLLRDDIWELAEYAKKKNLELRLNTNGVLIKNFDIAKRIADYFDNVLLPIQYSDISLKDPNAKAKLKAIKLLKKSGVKVLRVGTVATGEVIKNLNKVYRFIDSLPIDKWELYRVIATPQNPKSFSRKNVRDLVEGLLKIKYRTDKIINIINAIPFCSYDPLKIQRVAIGADAVDGHERFVIDPRGFAKPIYYMDENIGNPLDILSCWNHPFMKKMRNFEFVPPECKTCIFLERCRGGCRFSALAVSGNYRDPDPLMKASHMKKYLFDYSKAQK